MIALAGLTDWLIQRMAATPASPVALSAFLLPAALALLLWRRRRSLRFVETATLAWVLVALLFLFASTLFSGHPDGQERIAYLSPWLSVGLIAIFWVFPSRQASWVTSSVYALFLTLGLAYLLTADRSAGSPVLLRPLMHLYLANAVVALFLFYTARQWEQFDRTRSLARSMADLAHTDPLLGIPNRRQLTAVLERRVAEAKTGAGPGVLLMFDLDRFKQVNDTYGHEAGDHVLEAVVSAVRKVLRSGDWFGRWGGDEFIVLADLADPVQANLLAQRIREAVCSELGSRFWQVTLSLGVASYQPDDSVESWIRRADHALYQAKEAGRNRVIVGR